MILLYKGPEYILMLDLLIRAKQQDSALTRIDNKFWGCINAGSIVNVYVKKKEDTATFYKKVKWTIVWAAYHEFLNMIALVEDHYHSINPKPYYNQGGDLKL